LRPPPTKTTEFELKNRYKVERSKSRAFTVVILFFFYSNKNAISDRIELDKVVIVNGSNNAGVSEPSAAGGKRGFGGRILRHCGDFFFQKYAFLCIFWSKFPLKPHL